MKLEDAIMKLTGARIILECLKRHNVDTVFGYPGGYVINLYDALYDDKDINHIITAHEQGASHAADGYARATGKVGVCIATSGPGATNLVTGIATAFMDSVPIIAITGNVPISLLGKDSFQETDIIGITMPITKHNYQVDDPSQIAEVMQEAFDFAKSGRPGPVLIDFTKDAFVNECEYIPCDTCKFTTKQQGATTQELKNMIVDAKKPVIFSGGGTISSGAADELFEFAEIIQAPVSCSLMGISAFPADHVLHMGMVGMHGTKASNMSFTNCDLLIVLGARFSDRVTGKIEEFAAHANIIQVDIDAAEVNKNVITHLHVIGDIKNVLRKLNKVIPQQDHTEWIEEIKGWKKIDETYKAKDHMPKNILAVINSLIHETTIITTDVGQHQMWTAQYYPFHKNDRFITSGGMGTMGYGFGAAIGAQFGAKDKRVIHITGDGSFRMNLNEMVTTIRYNLPIITVLFDNRTLGMVRQWQTIFYNSRHSQTDLPAVDFCKIAQGFGYKFTAKVNDEAEFKKAFIKALSNDGPSLIQCIIDTDTMVLPMVPPGKAIDQIMMARS